MATTVNMIAARNSRSKKKKRKMRRKRMPQPTGIAFMDYVDKTIRQEARRAVEDAWKSRKK